MIRIVKIQKLSQKTKICKIFWILNEILNKIKKFHFLKLLGCLKELLDVENVELVLDKTDMRQLEESDLVKLEVHECLIYLIISISYPYIFKICLYGLST